MKYHKLILNSNAYTSLKKMLGPFLNTSKQSQIINTINIKKNKISLKKFMFLLAYYYIHTLILKISKTF